MCKFAEKDVLGGGFLNFDILSRFDFKQKNPFFTPPSPRNLPALVHILRRASRRGSPRDCTAAGAFCLVYRYTRA